MSELVNGTNKLNEFIHKQGIADLKSNLLKKQMKSQAQGADEENTDILLNIIYRLSDNKRLPIGLNLLAAYLEQYGYKARVLDISAQNLLQILDSEIFDKKINIVGFYCSDDNKYLVRNAIKYLKENSDVITFVGGPQAVALNEAFLRETGCDVVSEGEGEEALKELLDYYIHKKGSLKDIKNIKYIDENNQYCCNEMREPIRALDSLPFPKLKCDPKSEAQVTDIGYILTGRGCPFSCTFCYEGAHSKLVRYRSIKNVFEEIDYIIRENPQIKFLQVYDDTFTLDVKRVLAFCEEMKRVREFHNIYWCCEAHVSTLYKNPELITKMIEAGLHNVQIGIESGSQRVLNAYNKNTTPDMIRKVVKMCNDAKLNVLEGNIIIGGAWETQETIEESIKLAKEILRDGIGMLELGPLFYAPYPDTPMSKCPEKFGIEVIEDQLGKTISSMANAVVKTQALSREEIIEAHKRVENIILEEYKRLTLELDKSTIFRKFLYEDKSVKINCKWGAYINSYEHMRNYIKMATDKSYKFGDVSEPEKLYPIRTFELLEYVEDKLKVYGLVFENNQMKVLEYSTGRYTIAEIAELIGLDADSVYEICTELERRCFLYYSRI